MTRTTSRLSAELQGRRAQAGDVEIERNRRGRWSVRYVNDDQRLEIGRDVERVGVERAGEDGLCGIEVRGDVERGLCRPGPAEAFVWSD